MGAKQGEVIVQVGEGKYGVHFRDGVATHVTRHGEQWREVVGDKLIASLASELQEWRGAAGDMRASLKQASVRETALRAEVAVLQDLNLGLSGDRAILVGDVARLKCENEKLRKQLAGNDESRRRMR